MLFNSIAFVLFLPLVFLGYWFLFNKNIKIQNLFLVVVSYFFYGFWDWRFLFLIALTTSLSFLSGIYIRESKHPKLICTANIIINLAILGLFKYFNFFSENLQRLFGLFGFQLDWFTIDILLPVGISFYTFQALSYSIDVYKKKIEPTNDLISFFAFVSFFPQLVAGPIERATHLLPQFYVKRNFFYAESVDGMKQILWGFFKKMVIADSCAPIVSMIFNDPGSFHGSTLALGAFLFTFQIYGDFSGYSDIAIGVAKLFGFRLMHNFNYPYFAENIADFWRRWHISLTTWFRDYIYIPLGGSRVSRPKVIRNTFIIFLTSGFWHGANWTFIAWGFYHSLLFLPLLLTGRNRMKAEENTQARAIKFLHICLTFILVAIGWIIFRSANLSECIFYIRHLFSASLFTIPDRVALQFDTFIALSSIFILLVTEWRNRREQYALKLHHLPSPVRWAIYLVLATVCFISYKENQDFIYFQF